MKDFEEVTGYTFEEYYIQYKGIMRGFLLDRFDFISEEDIETSITNGMIKLRDNIINYDSDKSHLLTYLANIIKNDYLSIIRTRGRIKNQPNSGKNLFIIDDSLNLSYDDEPYSEELYDEMYRRIEMLPDEHRDIIQRRLDGQSYKDIARNLDMNINNLKSYIRRIKKKLKENKL